MEFRRGRNGFEERENYVLEENYEVLGRDLSSLKKIIIKSLEEN